MLRRTPILAVLAIGFATAATAPASAGCCCAMPCAAPPPVMVYQPYEMPQIYVVDQGPVYSGPGIYTNPTLVLPHPMPPYPYVGAYEVYRDRYLPAYRETAPLRVRAQGVLPRRAMGRRVQR